MIYLWLCIFWMLFLLYDVDKGNFCLRGWKFVAAVILVPGTLAAVFLGCFFSAFDAFFPKILRCFERKNKL